MLGIAAIVAAAAVPVFSNLVLESRMNAAVSTAMHAVNLARQFSATRSESHPAVRPGRFESLLEPRGLVGRPAVDRMNPTGSIDSCDLPPDGSPRIRSNRSTLDVRGRNRLRNAGNAHVVRPARRPCGARSHRQSQRAPARPACATARIAPSHAEQVNARTASRWSKTLIALALMLAGLAGAGIVLGRSIQYERESGTRRTAIRLAGSVAEELRALNRGPGLGARRRAGARGLVRDCRREPAGRQLRACRTRAGHSRRSIESRSNGRWPASVCSASCCR